MRRLARLAAVAIPLVLALAAVKALGATGSSKRAAIRKAGQDLFLRKGCVACHTLDGDADAVGTMGPDLSGLGQQMPAGRIRAFIADPRSVDATTSMPELSLTPRQVDLLASFILTPAPTPTPPPTPRPRPSPTQGF